MKRLSILLLLMSYGLSYAQMEEPDVQMAGKSRWVAIGTPFSVADIYGDTVDLRAWLDSGYCVLLDYFTLACTPCWNYHVDGVYERLYEYYGPSGTNQLRVAMIALEPPFAVPSVMGVNSSHDWTLGGTVPYPIICNQNCLTTCEELYSNSVPYVVFVSPTGYYCKVSLGFNHAENQTLVSSLISLAPSIGIETVPIVTIHGLSRVPKGCYNPYTALVDCVGEPSGYVWNLEGASFTYAVTEKVNVVWNSVGEYTVTLNVLNAAGNGSDTLVVNVFEWDWGDTLSYVLDEVEGCMGIDNVGTWGVRFPASAMCDRRQLDRVEVYMDTMSLGRLTMKVYQGGEAAPESLIYRKVTTISEAGWNSIDCGGGVCLDTSKCLWITFSSMASSPMAVVPYVGDSNSCMINVGEVWMPLYEYDPGNYDFEKSWMIRAVTSQYGTEDVEQPVEGKVNVYPNPTTSVVNVDAEGVKRIVVTDMKGNVLFDIEETVVDLGMLPSGSYVLHIQTLQGEIVRRVTKQ